MFLESLKDNHPSKTSGLHLWLLDSHQKNMFNGFYGKPTWYRPYSIDEKNVNIYKTKARSYNMKCLCFADSALFCCVDIYIFRQVKLLSKFLVSVRNFLGLPTFPVVHVILYYQ